MHVVENSNNVISEIARNCGFEIFAQKSSLADSSLTIVLWKELEKICCYHGSQKRKKTSLLQYCLSALYHRGFQRRSISIGHFRSNTNAALSEFVLLNPQKVPKQILLAVEHTQSLILFSGLKYRALKSLLQERSVRCWTYSPQMAAHR